MSLQSSVQSKKAELLAKLQANRAAAKNSPKPLTPPPPVTPKADTAADPSHKPSLEDPKHRRQFLRMYDRKAKFEAMRLDRAGVAKDAKERILQVAPKWLPVAERLGITELHGLRIVL